MILGRRWQDWAVAVAGLLVAASPLIYGWGGTQGAAWAAGTTGAWAALVLGGLLFLAGVAGLLEPRQPLVGFIDALIAVVLFFSPWLAGYAEAGWFAWTAWVAAVVVAAVIGTDLVVGDRTRVATG